MNEPDEPKSSPSEDNGRPLEPKRPILRGRQPSVLLMALFAMSSIGCLPDLSTEPAEPK